MGIDVMESPRDLGHMTLLMAGRRGGRDSKAFRQFKESRFPESVRYQTLALMKWRSQIGLRTRQAA